MLPELDEKITRERIAKRVAMEFMDGDVVNLGIGIPTLAADYIPEGKRVLFQAENGALGVGPAPSVGDYKCIGAGGRFISLLPGGSFFSSEVSFGLIRGNHVDATVLGSLEVDQHGNLANWWVPGKSLPGMGGAMDLVIGAKHVYVTMTHVTKKGTPKILKQCTLPLTAVNVVDMIVTEFAVFRIRNEKMTLLELAPEVSLEQIKEYTEADYEVSNELEIYKGL